MAFPWFNKKLEVEAKAAPLASIAEPDEGLLALFGAPASIAGPAVTPTTALQVPAVSCAVELISTSAGCLPLKVFRRLEKGGKEAAPDHPAYALANAWANPWTSAAELRTALVASALLHGHGFAAAVRIEGRVRELQFLDATTVKIETTSTGEPVYIVKSRAGEARYSWRDVIHVAAPFGSPIKRAREAIALALVMERHSARIFAKSGRPSGIIKLQKAAGDGVLKRLLASWHAAHSGENAGGTAILEEGASFEPIAFKSVDLELLAQRQFQIAEIARAFGLRNPSLLGDLSRATFTNLEEAQRQLLFALRPWLTAIEAAYVRVLLSDDERADYVIEHVTADFERADIKSRAEAYSKARATYATANEIRALENMPPHPDGGTLANPFVQSASATAPQSGSPSNE